MLHYHHYSVSKVCYPFTFRQRRLRTFSNLYSWHLGEHQTSKMLYRLDWCLHRQISYRTNDLLIQFDWNHVKSFKYLLNTCIKKTDNANSLINATNEFQPLTFWEVSATVYEQLFFHPYNRQDSCSLKNADRENCDWIIKSRAKNVGNENSLNIWRSDPWPPSTPINIPTSLISGILLLLIAFDWKEDFRERVFPNVYTRCLTLSNPITTMLWHHMCIKAWRLIPHIHIIL